MGIAILERREADPDLPKRQIDRERCRPSILAEDPQIDRRHIPRSQVVQGWYILGEPGAAELLLRIDKALGAFSEGPRLIAIDVDIRPCVDFGLALVVAVADIVLADLPALVEVLRGRILSPGEDHIAIASPHRAAPDEGVVDQRRG